MKRTTRNAAKTKQEIIEKAAPVFNVHGFSGTSMQMLVKATGYQMGGIYRHFDSKLALAKAVFEYNYHTLIQQNLVFDSGLSPKAQLLKIIENYKRLVLNPTIAGGCPILNTATEMDDTNEEFRQLTKSFIQEILQSIESILEEGKKTGSFKPQIDTKKEALFLLATFEGAILLGKITRKAQSFFDIFDQTQTYLEHCVFLK